MATPWKESLQLHQSIVGSQLMKIAEAGHAVAIEKQIANLEILTTRLKDALKTMS